MGGSYTRWWTTYVSHIGCQLSAISILSFSSFSDPAFALWPTIKQSAQQVVPEENVTRHINRLVQEFLGWVDDDHCLLIHHHANVILCM